MGKAYMGWPVRDTKTLSVIEWLNKYAINMDKKRALQIIRTHYCYSVINTERIYTEWRKRYIEI